MPEFEKEDEFFQTSEVHQNKNALENAVSVHSKKLLHKFPSKFFVFPSGDEP